MKKPKFLENISNILTMLQPDDPELAIKGIINYCRIAG